MKLGYARVSTEDQDLSLQLDALNTAGVERIFSEKMSGARDDRPELEALLHTAREGDTIIVWKLDRLARSLKMLVTLIEGLAKRKIDIQTLTGIPIDTGSASGTFIFQMFAALAEFERNLARERTMAGLAAARARGRKGGRRKKLTEGCKIDVIRIIEDGGTVNEAAHQVGVHRATIYKLMPEVKTLVKENGR